MKRILASMIILTILLSLFGCDFNLSSQDETTSADETASDEQIGNDTIAQFILDYEKRLLNSVGNNSKYDISIKAVNKIFCSLNLNKDASADLIIERYDMHNSFPDAEIRKSGYSNYISIAVDRNNFTEAMYQKLNQISEEDSEVDSLDFVLDETYVKVFVPLIEYYSDNALAINFEKANGIITDSYNESYIIKSKQEYDEYLNTLLDKNSSSYMQSEVNEARELYDDAFFEENALIITKIIHCPSGEIKTSIYNVYVSDNTAYVAIQRDVPTVLLDYVSEYNYTLIVPKNDVANVDNVITLD